jgi:hypothetical protein
MRLSARIVLCLLAFSLAVASGCRKPLTPNVDRNEAPETWITAAPLDTLTARDQWRNPLDPTKPAEPTTIPVRFHMYWAGSDKDGAVAGFYWAVVETTMVDGTPLPGPKPGQYNFTTKTDTTFMFTVSELILDREHVFFIYAVDNQGKVDPTPARFYFNAKDRFTPRPVIGPEDAWATGDTVTLSATGEPVPMLRRVPKFILDSLPPNDTRPRDRDTVPAHSRLDFRWRSEITQAGTFVSGYRYQLDETKMQDADAATTAVSYGTGLPGSAEVSSGAKTFTLHALDQSGGAGITSRYFYMNYVPETWWAGPDPARFPVSTDGEYNSRSVDVTTWPAGGAGSAFITNPVGALASALGETSFGPESLKFRPSKRFPPNYLTARPESWLRTFYEVFNGRLYARSEFDTVHMNSVVILWNGGYDKDSRYNPVIARDSVGPTDPDLRFTETSVRTGPVVEADGLAGSPIGFRSLIITKLTPLGLKNSPTQSSIYPLYDPGSVYRAARLGAYWRMIQAGKAYAVARAEDADGGLDNSVKNPVTVADAVDGGGGTPEERRARREVLVFYVNKAPALVRTGSPQFLPTEGQTINTSQWTFNLRGMDLDPMDPSQRGGSKGGLVIRYKVTLYQATTRGEYVSWTYTTPTGPYIYTIGEAVPLNFIPGGTMANNPFTTGDIQVSIQICDCTDCERAPGQGRCVDGIDPTESPYTGRAPSRPGYSQQNVITVHYERPAGEPAFGVTSSTVSPPGPDSAVQEIVK